MSHRVVIRPAAESELSEAYQWYETQRQGLGSEFLLSVEAALALIQRNPELYPPIHKQIRRALIRRFPFGVFYVVDEDSIHVLAVFHGKRNPKQWQQRV
jgi:plasmid stabilization system protein ParE